MDFDKFGVRCVKDSKLYVTSFKVKKLSQFAFS